VEYSQYRRIDGIPVPERGAPATYQRLVGAKLAHPPRRQWQRVAPVGVVTFRPCIASPSVQTASASRPRTDATRRGSRIVPREAALRRDKRVIQVLRRSIPSCTEQCEQSSS
jgi:hypothetical protein